MGRCVVASSPSKASDAGGADLPADASGVTNYRAAADLDQLDIDADRAELFFPDFYDDGPNADSWVSPPSAWPSVNRVLGPDAELQTTELYGVVDAALEQLPSQVADDFIWRISKGIRPRRLLDCWESNATSCSVT